MERSMISRVRRARLGLGGLLSVSGQRGWLVGAGTSWRRVFADFEMSMGRQFL